MNLSKLDVELLLVRGDKSELISMINDKIAM